MAKCSHRVHIPGMAFGHFRSCHRTASPNSDVCWQHTELAKKERERRHDNTVKRGVEAYLAPYKEIERLHKVIKTLEKQIKGLGGC